ncbi:MAG TPA: hypothetical protein VI278_00075 [Nitrososphaeraceae archaeon]
MKLKSIIMLLSSVTTMMAINAAGGSGAAFATTNTTTDPMRCDKPGYPSCYSIGYQAGKNSRSRKACRNSKSYCIGYEAGNKSGGSSSNNGGAARGTIGSSESDKIKGSDNSTSARAS